MHFILFLCWQREWKTIVPFSKRKIMRLCRLVLLGPIYYLHSWLESYSDMKNWVSLVTMNLCNDRSNLTCVSYGNHLISTWQDDVKTDGPIHMRLPEWLTITLVRNWSNPLSIRRSILKKNYNGRTELKLVFIRVIKFELIDCTEQEARVVIQNGRYPFP